MSDHKKPKLRGAIHGLAFICTILTSIAFLIVSLMCKFNTGVLIYLISQLLQYGISSFYHFFNWSPKVTNLLRFLDHMCIFILISGTQTSVLMNGLSALHFPPALKVIIISWSISAVGILKILILRKLHNIFDLAVYMLHGCIIVPFINVFGQLKIVDKVLSLVGGIFYLLGGLVYGAERPNPCPKVFGFHEVFHLLTVIANCCFAVVVLRPYVFSLFN
jgi:hemolysin III